MSDACLIELHGITAHFRDSRFNTGGTDTPLRTLHAPPPSTVFGLLCAAKGGWIEPASLIIGWQMRFVAVNQDFQHKCDPSDGSSTKNSNAKPSPVLREFLSFPVLSILALQGLEPKWIRSPQNPIALGRAEDLVIGYKVAQVHSERVETGDIENQFLPVGIGYGSLHPCPLYYDDKRIPFGNQLMVEARESQNISSSSQLMHIAETNQTFFMWDYGKTTR